MSSTFATTTTRTARTVLQRMSTTVQRRAFAAAAGSNENLTKTALNDLHKELGGDMVPFAGYELPVLYKGDNGGVMKEHLWCRADGKAALFDVSHMGQVRSEEEGLLIIFYDPVFYLRI